MSQQVSTLNNAVDHHVQTADTQRQIEINTDVTSTAISAETTTTRTLENINRSRVLHFVFRQLLQEYYTLTYLDDVSLMYSNGYNTSRKTGSLSSMGALLRSVLIDAKTVESVRNELPTLRRRRDSTTTCSAPAAARRRPRQRTPTVRLPEASRSVDIRVRGASIAISRSHAPSDVRNRTGINARTCVFWFPKGGNEGEWP